MLNSEKELERLYWQDDFKKGKSRRVDLAILELLNLYRSKERRKGLQKPDWFDKKWKEFEEIIKEEFPNISPYNLLHLPVDGPNFFRKENLFIRKLITLLISDSAEAHCFLGHAYRYMGKFREAAVCYQKAVELGTEEAKKLPSGNPVWSDVWDYEGHKIECLNRMGA